MKTSIKRLWNLMGDHKKFFIISVFLILAIQILGFVSPLIVKTILDDGVLGIEYDWVEVSKNNDVKTVNYQGKYYKQYRHLDGDDEVVKDVSIVILKNHFYFVNDKVVNGNKELNGNVLSITYQDNVYNYDVNLLNGKEVEDFYHPLLKTIIIAIICLFIKNILVIVFTYIQRILTSKVLVHLAITGRTKAFGKVKFLPIQVFEREPAGKCASRITNDVDGFIIMYRLFTNLILNAVCSFVFAYIGMFYLNWQLALLSFLIYPLCFVWIVVYKKYLKKIAEKVNELRSLLTAKINEIINGIQILQVFNFKKHTVDEFDTISKDYMNEQLKEVKLHTTLGWNMINTVKALITTAIIVYFGWNKIVGTDMVITVGVIYAYNEYLLKIVDPINIIFNQLSELQHSQVQMDRIHYLIDGDDERNNDKDSLGLTYTTPYVGDIRFENVWFSYVENEYVLKGISFNIKHHQTVGIVGATGAGKSSLMNVLLRFYEIDKDLSGGIYIDDVNIKDYLIKEYRKGLGIVLQEPILFKGTIASNIRFGKEGVSDEEIEEILYSIGGKRFLEKFKNGVKEEISRKGVNLSSGEKQIISLARALVHNPPILIMDEATSHIDTETEEMIKSALDKLRKDRTVIIIAHRLSTIYDADNIIVIDHGHKIEEGTHDELLKLGKVYSHIYHSQLGE